MKTIKRLVIKIGTSTLTHKTGLLNVQRFKKFVKVVADIKNTGIEVIIVSSGAIGLGLSKLKLGTKTDDISTKQAAATVGQCELMALYDKYFAKHNQVVAQILLTKNIVDNHIEKQNLRNTFNRLFEFKVIPIINENDSIAIEEIKFGDNDTLSAIIASLCDADASIILSDIDGLYSKDPNRYRDAGKISLVTEINDEIKALGSDSAGNQGTGGMITKITAAEICFHNSISMAIINGNRPENLQDVLAGKNIGTWFIKEEKNET